MTTTTRSAAPAPTTETRGIKRTTGTGGEELAVVKAAAHKRLDKKDYVGLRRQPLTRTTKRPKQQNKKRNKEQPSIGSSSSSSSSPFCRHSEEETVDTTTTTTTAETVQTTVTITAANNRATKQPFAPFFTAGTNEPTKSASSSCEAVTVTRTSAFLRTTPSNSTTAASSSPGSSSLDYHDSPSRPAVTTITPADTTDIPSAAATVLVLQQQQPSSPCGVRRNNRTTRSSSIAQQHQPGKQERQQLIVTAMALACEEEDGQLRTVLYTGHANGGITKWNLEAQTPPPNNDHLDDIVGAAADQGSKNDNNSHHQNKIWSIRAFPQTTIQQVTEHQYHRLGGFSCGIAGIAVREEEEQHQQRNFNSNSSTGTQRGRGRSFKVYAWSLTRERTITGGRRRKQTINERSSDVDGNNYRPSRIKVFSAQTGRYTRSLEVSVGNNANGRPAYPLISCLVFSKLTIPSSGASATGEGTWTNCVIAGLICCCWSYDWEGDYSQFNVKQAAQFGEGNIVPFVEQTGKRLESWREHIQFVRALAVVGGGGGQEADGHHRHESPDASSSVSSSSYFPRASNDSTSPNINHHPRYIVSLSERVPSGGPDELVVWDASNPGVVLNKLLLYDDTLHWSCRRLSRLTDIVGIVVHGTKLILANDFGDEIVAVDLCSSLPNSSKEEEGRKQDQNGGEQCDSSRYRHIIQPKFEGCAIIGQRRHWDEGFFGAASCFEDVMAVSIDCGDSVYLYSAKDIKNHPELLDHRSNNNTYKDLHDIRHDDDCCTTTDSENKAVRIEKGRSLAFGKVVIPLPPICSWPHEDDEEKDSNDYTDRPVLRLGRRVCSLAVRTDRLAIAFWNGDLVVVSNIQCGKGTTVAAHTSKTARRRTGSSFGANEFASCSSCPPGADGMYCPNLLKKNSSNYNDDDTSSSSSEDY